MKTIQIIIPVHNESANIPLLAERLHQVAKQVDNDYRLNYLWINDGSTDDSLAQIKKLAKQDSAHGYLDFSRNFGKESATSAGLHQATADAVIMIDADLQHPPELIPQLIQEWKQGAEVVIGVRQNNHGANLLDKLLSSLYYRIINLIGETNITPHATDFRLLDQKVIQAFNQLPEKDRLTRGLIDWLGFKRAYLEFDAPARENGRKQYSRLKLVKLALSSFIAHSLLPLKVTGYLGLLITLITGTFGLYVYLAKYVWQTAWGLSITGAASLALLIIFLVGLILSCLGLIALYIAQIRIEALNRPMYVIREKK